MRFSAILITCSLSFACTCPQAQSVDAEQAATSPQAPPPPAAEMPATAAAEATAAPATAPATAAGPTQLSGLAASVCPAGPYAAAPSGDLEAQLIPNTEPTALDPKDTEFHLYEGAVWLDGGLYFSDFKTSAGFPSRIMRYTEGQPLSVAVPDSGTNGLGLDPAGKQLVGASHKLRNVALFEAGFGSVREVAGKYQGQAYNSPNDVVYRSDGNLYFTDPDFQSGGTKPQPTTNVYRVAPNGEVTVVDDSIKNPNGISLSPDEQFLYVAGNLEQGYVKRYPIAADGAVGEGAKFLDPVVVPDGMVVDCAGNLYVTEHTPKKVRIIDPSGQQLGQVVGIEKNVTNVAFGGADRRTLYITTTGALYQLRLPIPGLPY